MSETKCVCGEQSKIDMFRAKLMDAQKDRDSWQCQAVMYDHAWARELEWLIPKHHRIDALVLTTRSLVQSEKSLRAKIAEIAALAGKEK